MVGKLAFQPDAEELLPFEELLNPSNEDINTSDPELDDIIFTPDSEDTDDTLLDPDQDYIYRPRPDIPSDTVILQHLSDLSLWAAQREGCTKENIASIDALLRYIYNIKVSNIRIGTPYWDVT